MTENTGSPAHIVLWQEFHGSDAPSIGHTTDTYLGKSDKVTCSLCDRIVEVLFGVISPDDAAEKWNYIIEYWWADGENEILHSYQAGEPLADAERMASLIARAQKHLEDEKGSSDPHIKAQIRRFKTVTYARSEEVVWTSG